MPGAYIFSQRRRPQIIARQAVARQNLPRSSSDYRATLSSLPIELHSKLDDSRVTRAIVLAEECAEWPSLIGGLASKVIGNDRFVISRKYGVSGEKDRISGCVGAVGDNQVHSGVDAAELSVV